MTAHKNREKEICLWIQERYPSSRVFRMDNGQAYAKHTVNDALLVASKMGITAGRSKLQIITYGVVGWPDLIMGLNSWTLGIEVKVGKDRQSDEQKVMESVFKKIGWGYLVVDDKSPLDQQLKIIEGMSSTHVNSSTTIH